QIPVRDVCKMQPSGLGEIVVPRAMHEAFGARARRVPRRQVMEPSHRETAESTSTARGSGHALEIDPDRDEARDALLEVGLVLLPLGHLLPYDERAHSAAVRAAA